MLSSLFNSPCTEKYKPASYNPQDSLTVQGSGHYEHCLSNMSEIFSFNSCPFSQCSFDNVFQPNITGSFVVSMSEKGWMSERGYTHRWHYTLGMYAGVLTECTVSYFCHQGALNPNETKVNSWTRFSRFFWIGSCWRVLAILDNIFKNSNYKYRLFWAVI